MKGKHRALPAVKLAPFAESHLEATWKWLHDEQVQEGFLLKPPSSRRAHRQWFEERIGRGTDDASYFAIEWQGRHIGNCGLKQVSARHLNAELFIYLDPAATGKGLASSAIKKLQQLARKRGLRKLYLHVRTNNLPALRLYLGNEFHLEGVFAREFLWRGQEVDAYRLSWFAF